MGCVHHSESERCGVKIIGAGQSEDELVAEIANQKPVIWSRDRCTMETEKFESLYWKRNMAYHRHFRQQRKRQGWGVAGIYLLGR